MGISQGGGLALAATALDNRVAYCVSSVPFLSNYPIYFETVNWPRQEFEDYIKKANSNITMDKVLQTLAYYDVKNLSQWIKCPVHFFIGLQDDVCPPIINFAAYNAIKSPKTYTVQAKKGHDGGGNTLMLEKIKAFFKL
jgi:cephalosporin-C deacetylase-like acetyl esterase